MMGQSHGNDRDEVTVEVTNVSAHEKEAVVTHSQKEAVDTRAHRPSTRPLDPTMPDERGLVAAVEEVREEAREAEKAMEGIQKSENDGRRALDIARKAMDRLE